jgi:transposase
MDSIYYVGFDIHKKVVAICVKNQTGSILEQKTFAATREALGQWAAGLDRPWRGAMEATLFTGWIYDFLKPYAEDLQVAHPLMLRAIAASKKKNDRVDAQKIADLLRCDLLPACYMAPGEIRELRRALRWRRVMVRQTVAMHNKMHGLLMEVGAPYDRKRLKGKKYFNALLEGLGDTSASVKNLLRLTRQGMDFFATLHKGVTSELRAHALLKERVERLMSIPGVGEVTALTWALEVGEPQRFSSIAKAVSYCGLCCGQHSSAGKERRGPISKQRNKHLQTVLIEAAKLAPRFSEALKEVHERELARGNRNRATLAVARRLVAWLLSVDRSGRPFEARKREPQAA